MTGLEAAHAVTTPGAPKAPPPIKREPTVERKDPAPAAPKKEPEGVAPPKPAAPVALSP